MSRQVSHLTSIARVLSAPRLQPFHAGHTADGRQTAVGRYAWNVALSEAFYPLLHLLEVAFRNTIDDAVATHYPVAKYDVVPSWLDAIPSHIEPGYSTASVQRAKEALLRHHGASKHRTATIPPGKLVAELKFGFWTALLRKYYCYQSAREPRFWPHLLPTAFPNLASRERPLAILGARFDEIRHLRNRIFHHEPIWNRPDLLGDRERILEALSWISPEAADAVGQLDRVRVVLADPARRWLRMRIHRCATFTPRR